MIFPFSLYFFYQTGLFATNHFKLHLILVDYTFFTHDLTGASFQTHTPSEHPYLIRF